MSNHVEVSEQTLERLREIARLRKCSVETALALAVREYEDNPYIHRSYGG